MRGARWDVGVGSGKMPSDLGLVTVCVSVLVDDGGTLVVSPELDCSRYAPVVTPPCMSLSLAFAAPVSFFLLSPLLVLRLTPTPSSTTRAAHTHHPPAGTIHPLYTCVLPAPFTR